MATTYLAPDPINSTQFIPGSNTPANGGQLFFYAAGTSTKQTVYKDNAAGTSWSNPIVLDSGGNLPSGGVVWFGAGQTYKVVFAPASDTDPPGSPYWSKDNLAGINDVSATSSEWVTGSTPTFVSATSFTLSGDLTSTYTVGRRIRTTNTGGTVYSTIVGSNFSGGTTTLVVANDSGVLDSGLSAVAYSILGTANASVPRATQAARPDVRGRLTLVSGQPVTSSDVSSATAILFTPYQGNTVDLYDGAGTWRTVAFTELSLPVPATTAVHDVFIGMNSSGAIALTSAAWTNFTTRAANLSTVSGVYVQSSDASRLYLGTYFGTTISGTTRVHDASKYRYLWNCWNRVTKNFQIQETTNAWLVTTGTWTYANYQERNSFHYVTGLSEGLPQFSLRALWESAPRGNVTTNTQVMYSAIAFDHPTQTIMMLDATNGYLSSATGGVSVYFPLSGSGVIPENSTVAGKHFLAWVEGKVYPETTFSYGSISGNRTNGITGSGEW